VLYSTRYLYFLWVTHRRLLEELQTVLLSHETAKFLACVADPGCGTFLAAGSGMEKKLDPGARMNISDLFFENLVSVFWVKNTKLFFAVPDPGSRILSTLDPGWIKVRSEIKKSRIHHTQFDCVRCTENNLMGCVYRLIGA
jgi:hypothetical protein